MRAMPPAAGLAATLLLALPAAAQGSLAESGRHDPGTGIRVPAGFAATVFADGIGAARHMAVSDGGVVYAAIRRGGDGGIVAMRDADGDGRADETRSFGDFRGTGIAIRDGFLYFGTDTAILRFRLPARALVPESGPETVVGGFPGQRQHATKPIAFDDAGRLYVGIGAPSNACQRQTRTPGSPGLDPCPQLAEHGGIWRFDADRTGQRFGRDGGRLATGLRNPLALDWHPGVGRLLVGTHGRDDLHRLFPDRFTEQENARLPAEEFHWAREGADYGWPYTYWDPRRGARMAAPEYGGDGAAPAAAGRYPTPVAALPAHWAPNDLVVYTGDAFPERFHGGAFIAFHGSWNRAPEPQAGFNVVFLPVAADGAAGDWAVFADGFAGDPAPRSPRSAAHRPTGVAVGPDGALYVSDDAGGRIWKITHTGG